MPPEETQASDTSQPVAEPQAEPVSAPDATQPEPTTTEPAPTPSEPIPSEPATAQIGGNEPIAPVPEPFNSAQDKPTHPQPQQSPNFIHELAAKAREVIQGRKVKKLEKIMKALNTKGKVTNDEVEKLLHVSDATATRYLSALEKQGKIKQVGKTGAGVVYTRI